MTVKQRRDSKGRFLPKDAHPEDYSGGFTDFLKERPYMASSSFQITRLKRPTPLWRVILGYLAYLALCFGAGVIGALVGVKL